ncbi:MAG: hypothetical protein JNL32_06865 [Candidatus Kapabacteria bacterium]|nr:hypothetical protein [Candidatus Kapabacteria bacterium]
MQIFALLKAKHQREERKRRKKRKPPSFSALTDDDMATDEIILIVAEGDPIAIEYLSNELPLSRVFEMYAQKAALNYTPE